MPTGTQLSVLRTMLRAEIGEELSETIAPNGVDALNQVINNQQVFLAGQHAFLMRKAAATVALTVGTQYYTVPTTIDMDRVDKPVWVKYGNIRYKVEFGIDPEEYNAFDSERGIQGAPVMRWDLVDVSGTRKIEVWPIPLTDQTLLFQGQLAITVMTADSHVCVIDDLLIVLFTAAELLARYQQADASAKLEKAKAHLRSLKASRHSKFESFSLAGAGEVYQRKTRRPVVGS